MSPKIEIENFIEKDLKEAYGILCAPAFGQEQTGRQSAGLTFCQIPPKGQTALHAHYETEFFQILSGEGLMVIEGLERTVKKGDVVRIPGFKGHSLTNQHPYESLDFLSIYSESTVINPIAKKALITSAPPTPNGPLHLGHISGPYLGADVLRRYLNMRGTRAIHRSGSDDFQNYVFEKSLRLNEPVTETLANFRAQIQAGLEKAKVQTEQFSSPFADETYQHAVQSFFEVLREKGLIRKQRLLMPHCKSCSLTLVDALLRGTCSYCNSPSSGACEACGIVSPAYEVLNPSCNRCGEQASKEEVGVYVFDLKEQLRLIGPFLERMASGNKKVSMLLERFKTSNFSPMIAAHPGSWGIPVRGDGNQVIHVWTEMAASYTLLGHDASEDWIHSFGMDNSFYYLYLVPSLLLAFSPESKLYSSVLVNEFLHLDGRKFSTSQGHAIWVNEFLSSQDADAVRLFLAKIRPEFEPTNFLVQEFQSFEASVYKRVRGLLSGIQRSRGEELKPESFTQFQKKFIHRLNLLTRQVEEAYHPEHFSLQRVYRGVEETLYEVEAFEKLLENPADRQILALGKRVLAKLAYPLVPGLAGAYLGEGEPKWEKDVRLYV